MDALSVKRRLAPGSMVVDILNNIGTCSNLAGKYEECLDYYKQALEDASLHDGPTSDTRTLRKRRLRCERSNALFNIGRAEVQRKEWDAAISVLSEAWRSSRESYGENHIFVAQTLDLLGLVQFSTAEIKSAVVSFKGALQIYLKVHGEGHEDVANSVYNIGLVREVKGDYENAWTCCSKSKKIYERVGTLHDDPGYECARRSVRRMEQALKEKAQNSKRDYVIL